ncbi:tannase/feruloyl esterase family alpha/beta hydrolase [Paracoccus aurantiacus]|uniref:Tannase/feruloyl esterase family alpha/beta hydrolase n=1 Tax=Paracoccus aurantiacus TaxID=2599412 RepID=A0A5C6RTN3_9RHOB|nr:tannase/feruloyl esterase family alpha/beta hydrolase [Paracoccus aurantiacus]TXB65671.1 tannase/feruloyl esterase family alpha/beta hydrolase [Paracoccus aurantiacus]
MQSYYLGAAFIALAMAPALAQDIPPASACADLAGVAAFDTIVSRAEDMPASDGQPAYCLVQGVIEPRVGAGQRTYGTGFELRMPANWSGRFLFQGGGGWDGSIRPAEGIIDRTKPGDTALARGFAVVATDAGHSGDSATDGWFGIDMKAREDNGYNSVRLVTERAKSLLARYYGQDPHHSYFMGCSNGGRQGMVAALRTPMEFDGVLSGAPAFDLTPSIIAWNWNTRALMDAAPADAAGNPIVSQAFSDAELKLVTEAALAACDADDGAEDGNIFRPVDCNFDPAILQCEAEETDSCLSPEQVTALQKIQAGPSDSSGEVIYTGWPLANMDGPDGMRAWMLGDATGAEPNARGFSFSQGWMRTVGATPPRPDFDAMSFDIDDRDFLMENAPVFAATSTDYQAFRDNGGKILWWHGNADPAFSVRHFLNWYQGPFTQANAEAEEFSRVFLVPGMHHCSGGAGPVSFDGLAPLVEWVENGTAPEIVPASIPDGGEDTERPLCAFPAYAQPDASGQSFICAE